MSIQYDDLRLTEVAAHIQIKKAMLELIVSRVDLLVNKVRWALNNVGKASLNISQSCLHLLGTLQMSFESLRSVAIVF